MNNLKQLETREVTVGENIFYIRPLPAFKAANMTGELAALVLPLVSGLAPLLSDVDTEKEGDGLLDIKVEDAVRFIYFLQKVISCFFHRFQKYVQQPGRSEPSAVCGRDSLFRWVLHIR